MPVIVDAHEDLAWNMLCLGRNYTGSAAATRRLEWGTQVPEHNGEALLGWEDYQRGSVAVVFSTLFVTPLAHRDGEWETLVYADYDQAHGLYWRELEAYLRLADDHPEQFRLVTARPDLKAVLDIWSGPLPERSDPEDTGPYGRPVGLVILMEGAEGVRTPGELEEWWAAGVRIIGPAWRGTRFCGGTGDPGPLTEDGIALLEGMADLGFILDISHMDEKAALQSLDMYPGRIIASHANALALLKGIDNNRHLSDLVIRRLVERGGVIGVVPANPFLLPGWRPADGKQAVSLKAAVAHIDHICQIAGDARHTGLGTDFEGGFGYESVPAEINTIGDLPLLGDLLKERGYSPSDTAAVLGQNWLSVLEETLPAS
jgi:membrane dipeptidase